MGGGGEGEGEGDGKWAGEAGTRAGRQAWEGWGGWGRLPTDKPPTHDRRCVTLMRPPFRAGQRVEHAISAHALFLLPLSAAPAARVRCPGLRESWIVSGMTAHDEELRERFEKHLPEEAW